MYPLGSGCSDMRGRKGVIVIGGCALGRFFLGNWCAAKLWASLWNPYQVIPFAEGYGDEGEIVQIWKGHISGLIGYIKILRITPSLFWALVHHLESTHVPASGEGEAGTGGGSGALLPAMQTIRMINLNCGAGNWLPQLQPSNPAGLLTNSYFDLDNTRFLELLICYLELRAAPLARLVIRECFGYTGAEVKLLRRLVGSVLWDGWGMIEGVYQTNGDHVGALTINHTLISRQKGYEELNLSEEDRRHANTTFNLE
ncbi:hypothetical protein C8J57DRAFT_1246634 [Mycena rebaudengoi]|nr:hypothetical protein C8J57DRAFT_1246634 [Mycena rebaudengoi]